MESLDNTSCVVNFERQRKMTVWTAGVGWSLEEGEERSFISPDEESAVFEGHMRKFSERCRKISARSRTLDESQSSMQEKKPWYQKVCYQMKHFLAWFTWNDLVIGLLGFVPSALDVGTDFNLAEEMNDDSQNNSTIR